MAGVLPDPLSRGTPPSAGNSQSSPANGGAPASIPGLGTWNGSGWSNSGFQGGAADSASFAGGDYGGNGKWEGGQSAGGFAEGGEVGNDSEGASDSDNSNSSTASLGDALNTIKDTLNFGRQQAMGKSAPGGGMDTSQMRPSTNVEDNRDSSTVAQSEGPQPKMGAAASPLGPMPQQTAQPYPYGPQVGVGQSSAGAGPVLGMDDGGDVNNPSAQGMPAQPQTNQPAPQPGQVATNATPPPVAGGTQPPNKMVGYAMGAGAVSPDVAQALKQKVDPQGTMDPSLRNMLAIAAAPDQQTQWGMMQHDRQKFNAYTAFARAAAAGTPQKPADIGAAANAATQAFAHVPDGTSTTFQPTQNGVVAHIKQLVVAKGKSSSHEDGGAVQGFDDGGGVLPDPSTGGGDSNSTGIGGSDTSQAPSQDVSIPMSSQQFQAVLAKMPYDAVMDKGAAKTFNDITGSVQGGDQSPEGDQIPPNAEETRGNIRARPGPQTTRAGRALRGNAGVAAGGGGAGAGAGGGGYGPMGGSDRPQLIGDDMTTPSAHNAALNTLGRLSQRPGQTQVAGPIDTSSGMNAPGTSAGMGVANEAAAAKTDLADQRNQTKIGIAAMQAAQRAAASNQRDAVSLTNSIRANDPKMLPDDVNKAVLQAMQQLGIQGGQPQGGQPQGQPNQQSPDTNQPQLEVQIPPAAQRVSGKLYQTPKGPARWMGNGWQVGQ